MSDKPYALLSDLHFHSWSSFSTVNPDGVNSRLQIIIDEVKRAKDELVKAGGDTMILAGDLFHTRGSVSPEVLNPVIKLFEEITREVTVHAIAGNHDLSSKDSSWLTNAASALIPAGVNMIGDESAVVHLSHEKGLILTPWFSSVDDLKVELKRYAKPGFDAIIHAPVDGVIPGLPDHGLTHQQLSTMGFDRVFAGHYHNFNDFGDGVYSIGATTHQTWSDVGSKAGFLLVYPDRVERKASHAPDFVDIYGDMTEEELLVADGNYCRLKIGKATPEEIKALREEMITRGAKGVVIQAVKETTIETRQSQPATSLSLEQSVADYIAKSFSGNTDLATLCHDILSRVDAVEV